MRLRTRAAFTSAPAFVLTVPFNRRAFQFGSRNAVGPSHRSKVNRCRSSRAFVAIFRSDSSKDVTKNFKQASMTENNANATSVFTQLVDSANAPTIIALSTFIVTIWGGGLSTSLAELTEDISGTVTEAAKEAVTTAADTATEAVSDDDLFSKGLFYLAFGLLIYVSVGVVILSINKFIVNRNDRRNRKWVKDRLEGRPVPPNVWLKDPKDAESFPDDFPVKPKRSSSSEEGNRQQRRVMKKSRDKERPKKPVDKRDGRALKSTSSEKRKKKS